MDSSNVQPPRVRVAILLSVAIHLCALLLLPSPYLLPGTRSTARISRGQARVFAVTLIVHRTAVPRSRPPLFARQTAPPGARRTTPAATVRRGFRPPVPPSTARGGGARPIADLVHSPRARRAREAPPRTPNTGGSRVRATPAVLATATTLGPVPNLTPPVPVSTPTLLAATPGPATPAATPSLTPNPAVAERGNFNGLFSQNYPPALPTSSTLEAVRSRLAGHGRIRIDVDELGHATGVQFITPVADDAGQDVRTRLLDAAYVAADCNGLPCAGTLELSY